MTRTEAETVSFRATIAGSGGKAGIVIPQEVIQQLGAGRRPAVLVELNGYAYRSTVAVMGGKYMVGVNASVRKATGLEAGHAVTVALSVATTPREVELPQDFVDALAADEPARTFFDGLSNSLQRYHVDSITGAKTAETRQRRVDRALALFREGKKR